MSMLFNHQLPFFMVYSMSSSCNWQIPLWPCSHVFYSTSDQFISGFDSYMSTMVIFPDKLFSRLFQDYNPSTSNLHFYTLLPLASVYIKYFRLLLDRNHVAPRLGPRKNFGRLIDFRTKIPVYIQTLALHKSQNA